MSQEPVVDNHVPGERWEFNEDVAKQFDLMLEKSIPGYGQMRDLVYRIGKRFVQSPSNVIDLGASRGEAVARFIAEFPHSDFFLSEVSEPMLAEMHERFADLPNVFPVSYDLRKTSEQIATAIRNPKFGMAHAGLNPVASHTTLVLSILTMIFVPINFRPSIYKGVYDGLARGGAFIVVEKVLGNSAAMQELLVDVYHEYKHDNGYSWEAIERKRAALEGVQVPVSHETNIDMLRAAGFRNVESFWRNMNFVAYLAIKD
ncbi:tRNA methyltransferase [Pseudomonas phage PaBG]|uniref:tRNA (Cmo5U34)-methyltransferase n=1 Tax=Pseudomonas phage PaBG TaxID=1335230 RepID=S5VMD2_9CAUD|nr:tRNA methyltransferase [Pseudomonas phage PaBG]AGS82054.1 tRNA (cmo5U34)-methyltransferase [Pseudomonas phage PaBG]